MMKKLLLSLSLGLFACSGPDSQSDLSVVSIPHTEVKWQSIGNCWAYGALGWAESIILIDTGLRTNFSESYMTYRHFEEQLLGGEKELKTGGSFAHSRMLIARFGLMYEGDFIPDEAVDVKSLRQEKALAYLKKSLSEGELKNDSSSATIRRELDRAFGVQLVKVEPKIVQAYSIKVGATTLWEEMRGMQYAYYPGLALSEKDLPYFAGTYTASEIKLQKRVMKALIDRKPVVVNWFVDFNALSADGIFSSEGLQPGRQGYHSVVVDDFTAEYVEPGSGTTWMLPEGRVPEEHLAKVLEYGRITSLIVKNSWGGDERPDRPSYTNVDGESGYAKILDNYAFGSMKEMTDVAEDAHNAPESGEKPKFKRSIRGIQSFVLPAGY